SEVLRRQALKNIGVFCDKGLARRVQYIGQVTRSGRFQGESGQAMPQVSCRGRNALHEERCDVSMTKKIGNVLIISPESARRCTDCGKDAECRPYGPGGAQVCFPCAMKDREDTEERFAKILNGEEL